MNTLARAAARPEVVNRLRTALSLGRRRALWLGLLLALLVLGIPIRLGPFRGAIESRASEALGRDVRTAAAVAATAGAFRVPSSSCTIEGEETEGDQAHEP
jgi:hypothetical protein